MRPAARPTGAPAPRRPAGGSAAASPVEIIGHRGARGLFAENTLEGFLRTVALEASLGVDAIELDVGLTADGVVVVHHDRCLNPALTRDASGRYLRSPGPALCRLSAVALAHYDVGRIDPAHRRAAMHPAQQPFDGARIPRLAEVLAALPAMRFVIELKSDPSGRDGGGAGWPDPFRLADATAQVCDAAPDSQRFVLQSFDRRPLQHLLAQRPDIALAWLTTAATPAAAQAVAAAGGRRWSPAQARLTAATVCHAKALGLRVIPWTVNQPAQMRRLIDAGVNGLITDRPDLARHVVGQRAAGETPLTP